MEVFLCNKRKIAVKPTLPKIQLSQKRFWENIIITDHKYRFWILKITVFLPDMGYLQTTKQPLGKFEDQKPW